MNRDEQDTFDSIIDRYNAGVEPLENWTTADIVSAVRLLDAELQRRHDEGSRLVREPGCDDDLGEDEDEFDLDEDGESLYDDSERF